MVAIVAIVLLTAAPVGAITYGQQDVNNTYSNVGAMLWYRPSVEMYDSRCSGTLIAPTVFLTASHCIAAFENQVEGNRQVYVSFEPMIEPVAVPEKTDPAKVDPLAVRANWILATPVINPEYSQRQGDSGDIGALILSRPASEVYPGITPATLPPAGFLDRLSAQNGLKGTEYLAVGYGLQERVNGGGDGNGEGGGQPFFKEDNWRRYAISGFNALNKGYLRLTMNPSLDYGGTCYGDSGGPNFHLPSMYLVAVTVTGDVPCRSTNVVYRTDTTSAIRFFDYLRENYGVTIP
jgi:hypothetical protein